MATACNAHGGTGRHDFESETFLVQPQITHALTSEGADASEDGTGRGTPIVAFSSKDYGHDSQQNISPTLRSMNFDQSHINGGGQIAIAYREVAPSLTSNYGKQPDNSDTGLGPNLVMSFAQNTRDEVRYINGDGQITGALAAEAGMKQQSYISGQYGVRRLTPLECERLQGFPDEWTRYGDDGKEINDSARYRMLGNAVCLPTVEWIARRIFNN